MAPPIGGAVARPLSAGAIALMLVCCFSWGFNQIAVKLVLPEIPPFLQAAIRSSVGMVVLLIIAWARGVKLFQRDGRRHQRRLPLGAAAPGAAARCSIEVMR